jgi:hypothetical protein
MIWSTLYPTDGLSHVTEVVLTAVSVSPAAERRKITSKMCFFEDLLHWNGDTKENMEMSNDLHNITAKVVMFLHTMRNFMKKVQSKWIKHRAFELYDVHDMSKNCTLRKIKQNCLYIGTGSQTISFKRQLRWRFIRKVGECTHRNSWTARRSFLVNLWSKLGTQNMVQQRNTAVEYP